MATRKYIGGLSAVAQVKKFIITAVGTSDVWTLTLYGEDNSTATVTYTEDGSATTTEVGAGLYAAAAASTHRLFRAISWSNTQTTDVTDTVVMTAVTAGAPIYAKLGSSGSGTWTVTDTTASRSPNDFNLPNNWDGGVAAGHGDSIIFGPGASGVYYGLYQSGSYSIANANTGTEALRIDGAGDLSHIFTAGRSFAVAGSTGNDGTWVVSSTAYSASADTFTITVTGDITDATADGTISITFASITTEEGFTGALGTTLDKLDVLITDTTGTLSLAGTGAVYIDINASDIDPIIYNSASYATGVYGVNLLGTAIDALYVLKGNIRVLSGSEVEVIYVGNSGSPSDALMLIETDVDDKAGSGDPDVTMYGGAVVSNSDVTTLNAYGTAVYTQKTGKWTTANLYDGAIAKPDANGVTYATTNVFKGSKVDNSRSVGTKTMTNITMQAGSSFLDPTGAITKSNGIVLEDCGLEDVTISAGKNKTWTPS